MLEKFKGRPILLGVLVYIIINLLIFMICFYNEYKAAKRWQEYIKNDPISQNPGGELNTREKRNGDEILHDSIRTSKNIILLFNLLGIIPIISALITVPLYKHKIMK